jgi:hypothetical protein
MTKFKSFSSPITNNSEPVAFEVNGHTFRCNPGIQGRRLIDFLSVPESDSATSLLEFLDSSIVAADRDRFRGLTTSDDTIVPLDVLSDISAWLIGIYSGNPTSEETSAPTTPQQPESSLPGETTTLSSYEDTQLPMV